MTADGLDLSVEVAVEDSGIPGVEIIENCVRRALAGIDGEVAVRIVDERESAYLNERFRGKRGATNVLAFPAGETLTPASEPRPLGDIVICAPIVAREARKQEKPVEAHWAHVVIHGCLHLIGYDHLVESDARTMETRERQLLAELGIDDPYRDEP